MAALAIGLVVVWGPALKQIIGGMSGTQATASPRLAVAEPTLRSTTKKSKPDKPRVASSRSLPRERVRPTITVVEAGAYDPFAPPAWSPSSRQVAQTEQANVEPSELESRFGSLRQTGVAMILVSSDGRAAQVGDRTLRVGDTIDGFEVIEINADGVTFKPAPPEPEGDARGA